MDQLFRPTSAMVMEPAQSARYVYDEIRRSLVVSLFTLIESRPQSIELGLFQLTL
jgi:hypothetical protein